MIYFRSKFTYRKIKKKKNHIQLANFSNNSYVKNSVIISKQYKTIKNRTSFDILSSILPNIILNYMV